MAGIFARIFSFDGSKKWIIRDGRNGISLSGSGAPSVNGAKKFLGVRTNKDLRCDQRCDRSEPKSRWLLQHIPFFYILGKNSLRTVSRWTLPSVAR